MAVDTKIPGLGHFNKKELYIGGAGIALVIGFALYRSHKNAAAAAAAAATASTDSSTGSAGAIDPTTGDVVGSPEDIAALEAQSSYANDTAYGYSSGEDYGSGTGTAMTGVTSNAQWAQAAEQYLTQYADADPTAVSTALGAYVTGSLVTAAQVSIVEQAIAFEGYPPQSGSNGYPPSIETQPTSTGTTTTTPTGPVGPGGTPGPAGKVLPPPGTTIYPPAEIKPGNTLQDIANHFGIGLAHLLQFNPSVTASSPTGTTVIVPYLIKSGMTLQSVASQFGISVPHLQEYL
jgi:LysM repeat protein